MIKHIVFFKLADNSESNKNDIKARFMSMIGKIEGMQNLEVGINFSTEERAFDLALSCDFTDKEGLKFYATHPVHVAIVTYLKSINTVTKVVDYEY
ncbi:MAG: Dabb family protein [Sulfurospirillaceae bacterium]|nr:Dabb family protein [Sulfurospirillaceae bacterium]MDD2827884.1 Dabb family protein [Sulfurospirillaceae bacterium]